MARTQNNPDRNFSTEGIAENNEGRNATARRKIVATRFRRFFDSLTAQLTAGSAQLWEKASRPPP